MEKKIELTLPLVNAVLQYLGTRPYQEVHGLIAEIQKQATPQVSQPSDEPAGLDE